MRFCLFFRHKSTEATKALLEKGADPSIPDEEAETPLHFAARRGYKGDCSSSTQGS